MSKYAKINGELKFNSRENYDKAKKVLQDGGWVLDGQWIDESGEEHDSFNDTPLTIEIPLHYYRNLIHFLDEIISLSNCHDIVWASTDGMFSGGVLSSGGNTSFNLEEWAENNGMEKPKDSQDEDGSVSDDYLIWQDDVVDAFMEDQGEF